MITSYQAIGATFLHFFFFSNQNYEYTLVFIEFLASVLDFDSACF